MVMRYESIRGELSLPSLQELWQNGFGILEKGAECKVYREQPVLDPEAHWTTSIWYIWIYNWKLHLVCTAGRVWMPLAAERTPANAADNLQAPGLFQKFPMELRFLLHSAPFSRIPKPFCQSS